MVEGPMIPGDPIKHLPSYRDVGNALKDSYGALVERLERPLREERRALGRSKTWREIATSPKHLVYIPLAAAIYEKFRDDWQKSAADAAGVPENAWVWGSVPWWIGSVGQNLGAYQAGSFVGGPFDELTGFVLLTSIISEPVRIAYSAKTGKALPPMGGWALLYATIPEYLPRMVSGAWRASTGALRAQPEGSLTSRVLAWRAHDE